jgi:hypothetical protein
MAKMVSRSPARSTSVIAIAWVITRKIPMASSEMTRAVIQLGAEGNPDAQDRIVRTKLRLEFKLLVENRCAYIPELYGPVFSRTSVINGSIPRDSPQS